MVKRPRGTCRVCGRDVALTPNGRIGQHWISDPWFTVVCDGWARFPKEEPK